MSEPAAADHGTRERELIAEVDRLADAERHVRDQRERGELDEASERAELQRIEERRDQVWDLVRQRRALAENGQDPDMAEERPVAEVESYRQ